MKTINPIYALLAVLLLTVCSACTQNNGNIGSLFGTWSVNAMTVNGETPEDFVSDETYWSFQNDIIYVQRDLGHHQYYSSFGSWEEDDNHLTLNFAHQDNLPDPSYDRYLAPTWLGFSQGEIVELTYITKQSRRMVLTWTNSDGDVYIYTLIKTY